MTHQTEVVTVCPRGDLDRPATERLVRDVHARLGTRTSLIVVSLAETTSVHWNALCILCRVANGWRAAMHDVVLKEARPSVRAMLATVNEIVR